MAGYQGFQKQKSKLGTTLTIVAFVHVLMGGGLYWLSQTEFGQNLIKVYKLNAFQKEEKPPEPPPPEKEPEPEPPPPPKPEPKEAPPPPPQATPPPIAAERPTSAHVDTTPFAIGQGRGKISGYADLLTASIQQKYSQPPALPDNLDYAVLCELVIDAEGHVLEYRLVNSSGSLLFDQSALDALAKLTQVRPPPEGMDRAIVVKFFPPA
ncbi:MAG: TonB family protein [Nitrospiraceae bacterium]